MSSPRQILFAATALLPVVCIPANAQVTATEKLAALARPTCVLPMGQTIDVADLPKDALRTDWMAVLSNKTPLSLVSIPATHDAGTALGRTGWTRCQVMTIPAQLAAGIRGFDIRLRLVGNDLLIYHGEESQSLKFVDVMTGFKKFLHEHPRELLVMRVREESAAVHATETFESAFGKYQASKEFGRLFYRAKSRTEIPTVGRTRGRIVLLDNYGKIPDAIDYPNPSMSVQDDWEQSDMHKKAAEIIAKIDDGLGERTGAVWNVNYTSSSTATVDQLMNAVAVNPIVDTYLRGKHGHVGVILCNFPGLSIIDEIIDSNRAIEQ